MADVVPVVAREEDDRPVAKAQPIERVQQPPHVAVDRVDARQVLAGPRLHRSRSRPRTSGMPGSTPRRAAPSASGTGPYGVCGSRKCSSRAKGRSRLSVTNRMASSARRSGRGRERLLPALHLERRVHGRVPAVDESEEALEAERRGVRAPARGPGATCRRGPCASRCRAGSRARSASREAGRGRPRPPGRDPVGDAQLRAVAARGTGPARRADGRRHERVAEEHALAASRSEDGRARVGVP